MSTAKKKCRRPGGKRMKPGPKPMAEEDRLVTFSVRIPRDVLKFIDQIAHMQQTTRSKLFMKAVILFLDASFGSKFYLKYFAPKDKMVIDY